MLVYDDKAPTTPGGRDGLRRNAKEVLRANKPDQTKQHLARLKDEALIRDVAPFLARGVLRLLNDLEAGKSRLRQENARLRWFYENMREADRMNLETEYEAAHPRLGEKLHRDEWRVKGC